MPYIDYPKVLDIFGHLPWLIIVSKKLFPVISRFLFLILGGTQLETLLSYLVNQCPIGVLYYYVDYKGSLESLFFPILQKPVAFVSNWEWRRIVLFIFCFVEDADIFDFEESLET